jgi:phosphoribosylglycinamide formyltransferase-1
MSRTRLPVVGRSSGNGINLQTLVDGQRDGDLPIDIRGVVSNRADAYGLERARMAGIDTHVLDHRDYHSRETYDAALLEHVQRYQPGLVVMAGFMRILTPGFVAPMEGRLINIHPSLLPAFRGLHTHERALQAGVSEHGCSVHFVIPELDAGPVIVQARVPVHPGDTAERLAARVQAQEHRVYPLAVRWIAQGRAQLRDGQLILDGRPCPEPPVITAEDGLATL